MSAIKIVRFDAMSKEGLPAVGYTWLKNYIVAGDPKESLFVALKDKTGAAGVWQAEAGTYQMENYPSFEFCLVLEGFVVITDLDGHKEHYGAGEPHSIGCAHQIDSCRLHGDNC